MQETSMSKTFKVDSIDEAVKLIQDQKASNSDGLQMSSATIYRRYDTKAKSYVGYSVSIHFITPLASVNEIEELD